MAIIKNAPELGRKVLPMKLRLALLAGSALLGGAIGVPAQAQDITPRAVDVIEGHGEQACPDGAVCLYRDYYGNGSADAPILRTDQDIPWLGDYGFNDTTSSACNHTPVRVVLFEDAYFEGSNLIVYPGDCVNVPEWFNDLASSVRFV
ncbi:peptidase inhibitor family I36 protein [Saccharopolyspora hirsuta]|uniref:peptidase inhibitor family I36 protein n=1 Tax=Saccharopolyspora hirsuta TaxID=1837 RepID=UPI0014797DAD|nr:peptidase inhibitor family I36 protein [Saccharopolyspora hirsuta]